MADITDILDEIPDGIAIVGMAGRFPGAQDLEELWRNLRAGVESVRFFSREELLEAGVDPAVVDRPGFVPATALLEDGEWFDAGFFGMNRRQAETLDPQHRLFLECAVTALEDAGYDPAGFPGSIGLWGGASWSSYWSRNLWAHPEIREDIGLYQLVLANDKDFLATRVAWELDLRGPCMTVQTACSTSLVAVHLACQSLLNGECDLALAGGVSMSWPRPRGYRWQEGGILSPDGHCRAFDAQARGTVGGQGVGIVVLKRLDAALEGGDTIRAILRGSALNNDGSLKAGFTAPSVERQREVVKEALAVAGVDPATVSYVEAHGTGTELGDPIEVAALTEAFRASTSAVGFCALGSLKSNMGHLDAAAGVAGLIKTVLALEHGEIPPSLHFETPNPRIDFASSPFYVNARLAPWTRKPGQAPRRAGVSAFGIGGTNAHVVLEEAPSAEPGGPGRPWQVVTLSARSATALERASARLVRHLRRHPGASLPDIAYTLRVGRHDHEHRRFAVCRDAGDAAVVLSTPGAARAVSGQAPEGPPPAVVFLFPGQGAQQVGMGRELYDKEPLFRAEVDRCAGILRPHLGLDLRTVLYPPAAQTEEDAARLDRTDLTQPALFVVEYALARLWQSWGIEPRAMLGHSIGEYVAACLAGVFGLEDALRLVAVRGRLLQALPGGAMLAVPLPCQELLPLLGGRLDLAAVNSPSRSVVAGPAEEIAALEERLAGLGLSARRLRTSHAFHSAMVEPAMAALAAEVARTALRPPEIPFLSNVTGTWITAAQATDPQYWSRHLRETVRFADGLRELAGQTPRVLLEVGPGKTLTSLVRQQGDASAGATAVASLSDSTADGELQALLTAAGRLWLAGAPLDGATLHAGERRRRVPLPTYPFERRPYWIEPASTTATPAPPVSTEAPVGGLAELEHQLALLAEQLGHLAPAGIAPERKDA